jgi:phospholipase/carboxylesterase
VWRELAAKRGPLNVLQSHGRHDPILPFEAAIWLREMFDESGFDVDFIEFPGIHTIPHPALVSFAQILDRLSRTA